jgi:hypothetical protein
LHNLSAPAAGPQAGTAQQLEAEVAAPARRIEASVAGADAIIRQMRADG